MDSEEQTGVTAADEQFLAAFEAEKIANQDFHHRDHLRLAWIQIRRLGQERASDTVAGAIRRFAVHHGHADRYQETMTRFWVRVVGMGVTRHPRQLPVSWGAWVGRGTPLPPTLAFDALLVAEPHLLDKNLPYRHWSRERMGSDEAKRQWTEPDLIRMPAAYAPPCPPPEGEGKDLGTRQRRLLERRSRHATVDDLEPGRIAQHLDLVAFHAKLGSALTGAQVLQREVGQPVG